eukprot:1156802-Pelagomonas_calceolata.AAC.2
MVRPADLMSKTGICLILILLLWTCGMVAPVLLDNAIRLDGVLRDSALCPIACLSHNHTRSCVVYMSLSLSCHWCTY